MTHHRHARGRRATALSLTLALAAGTMVGALAAAPAEAAAPPVVQRDATNGVTADLLPTTQINASGWVEDQAIKGDTVFAGGKFSSARPAGAAEGTSESARTNLLAYSLSTGVLNTGFKPTLNNAVHVLALSPDNTRLYVGGEFTTVNGSSRSYIVAFDTSNGQVVTTFKASLNGPVRALAVTSSTVYVGGSFSQANGNNRAGLAAFRTSDGGLLSGWTPSIDRSTSTVSALAQADRCSQPTMTGLVNGLADKGWVQRTPHPDDARSSLVTMTDEGATVLASVRRTNAALVAGRIERSGRSPADLATAVAVLSDLLSVDEHLVPAT